MTVSLIPTNANIVTKHVFYKVKKLVDGPLTLILRIAVHGRKQPDKEILMTDGVTCPMPGIRILLSLTIVFRWILGKIDFKSALLQTSAHRNVYVLLYRVHCKFRRRHYWLLLSVASGLANEGAKWHQLSDDFLQVLYFGQIVQAPQLFYMKTA